MIMMPASLTSPWAIGIISIADEIIQSGITNPTTGFHSQSAQADEEIISSSFVQ